MRTLRLSTLVALAALVVSAFGALPALVNATGELAPASQSAAPSAGQGAASTVAVPAGSVNVRALPRAVAPEVTRVEAMPRGLEPVVPGAGKGPVPRFGDAGFRFEQDTATGNPQSNAPSPVTNWEGPRLFTDSYSIPPDPHIAVGPGHVTVVINSRMRTYTHTGVQTFDVTASSFFAPLGLPAGTSIFDPWIVYDLLSNKWLMTWAAMKSSTSQSWWLVGCSWTTDPTGTWWIYALDATLNGSTPTANWADYPRLGVNKDGITLSANMFAFAGGFQYTKMRFLNKATICSGGSAGWWDQWGWTDEDNGTSFTMVPTQGYDNIATQYTLNATGTTTRLTFWRITNVLSRPPTFSGYDVNVDAYSSPVNGVQPGGVQAIDVLGYRILNTLARNGKLYGTHMTGCDWGYGTNDCLRYYRLSNLGGAPTVELQPTFGVPTYYYTYPSITVDGAGNIGLGFSRSSASEYVSSRYTGRKTTDAVTQSSAQCAAGVATYLQLDNGRNRWGDYTGAAIAPDLATFFFFNEYVGAANTWYTRICTARFIWLLYLPLVLR